MHVCCTSLNTENSRCDFCYYTFINTKRSYVQKKGFALNFAEVSGIFFFENIDSILYQENNEVVS